MYGEDDALLGGSNKWVNALALLGATMQDISAAQQGRQGNALLGARQMLAAQKKQAEEASQKSAQAALLGGLDPTTGITWNQPRQGTSADDQKALFMRAFPEAGAKAAAASLFPKPMDPSDRYRAVGDSLVDITTGKPIYQAPSPWDMPLLGGQGSGQPTAPGPLLGGGTGGTTTQPRMPISASPIDATGAPLGIRNNNPGNIRVSDIPWNGKAPGGDGGFERFNTPEDGVSALTQNLLTYQDKHGLNTIEGIINRWAPASDNNNVGAYVSSVAQRTGLDPKAPLNLRDPNVMKPLVAAIIQHENGRQPYDPAVIDRAVSARLGSRAPAQDFAAADMRSGIDNPARALPPGTSVVPMDGPSAPMQPVRVAQANTGTMTDAAPAAPAGQWVRPMNRKTGQLAEFEVNTATGASRPYQKPPEGYQWTGDGKLAPIPGGPKDDSGGGPFAGNAMDAQASNIVVSIGQRLANGEEVSPQERFTYELAQRHLMQPRVVPGPDGSLQSVAPTPLPAFPAQQPAGQPQQAAAAPVAPASPPQAPQAPATPGQPGVTTILQGQQKPTNEQSLAAGFGNRLAAANQVFADLEAKGYVVPGFVDRAAGATGVGNLIASSEYQQLEQAQREFVNAQLRRESGAAIADSEFENARKQYFPQPGDSPAVLAQKKKSREMALENMRLAAGPLGGKITQPAQQGGGGLSQDEQQELEALRRKYRGG